jgi:hypothetical protein
MHYDVREHVTMRLTRKPLIVLEGLKRFRSKVREHRNKVAERRAAGLNSLGCLPPARVDVGGPQLRPCPDVSLRRRLERLDEQQRTVSFINAGRR